MGSIPGWKRCGVGCTGSLSHAARGGGSRIDCDWGVAPNRAGVTVWGGSRMSRTGHARAHKQVTSGAQEGARLSCKSCTPGVTPTRHSVWRQALENAHRPFRPRALTSRGGANHPSIREVCGARPRGWLRWGGGDGVGRVFDQRFIAAETNHRNDAWGGNFERRCRFPIILSRMRAVGEDFIVMYRLSMRGLVAGGSDWSEVTLAQHVERRGDHDQHARIGWHETRIPTIATMVPRGVFSL